MCIFCVCADGWCLRLRWLLSWPVSVLLHCTIPNCSLPQWERWYLLTFLTSTLWIALFSYLMVWMVRLALARWQTSANTQISRGGLRPVSVQVTIVSFTLGIPEVIMGITFLAAGTSVPDCMASLIVARQGLLIFIFTFVLRFIVEKCSENHFKTLFSG